MYIVYYTQPASLLNYNVPGNYAACLPDGKVNRKKCARSWRRNLCDDKEPCAAGNARGLVIVNFAMEVVIQRANNPIGRDFDLVSADVDYRASPEAQKHCSPSK